MKNWTLIKKRVMVTGHLLLSVLLILLVWPEAGLAQRVAFQDDFESGTAVEWNLEAGWDVFRADDNYVLRGQGHSMATITRNFPLDSVLECLVKLTDEQSAVHIVYRTDNCQRYFIGLSAGTIYLSKTQPCGTHTDLVAREFENPVGLWQAIKIVGQDNNIKVYLGGDLKISYTDPDPVLFGGIALECLDDMPIYIDDVKVTVDASASENKWIGTNGPPGGLGYDIRIHPTRKNVMFVTDNYAGVLKSENAGLAWSQNNTGITVRGGATLDTVNIFCLTMDPNNPEIIWTGTFGEGATFGVFKSVDGGINWTNRIEGIGLDGALGLVFRGFTIEPGNSNVVYAQAEVVTDRQGLEFGLVKGRVYKTINGGDSWSLIWQGDNLARYLIVHPQDHDVLFLSTGIFDREAYNSNCPDPAGGVGVLKSIDGGLTWTASNNGLDDLYVGALRMHPDNPDILFAATGCNSCSGLYSGRIVSGLFRTLDGGASWTKVVADEIMTTVNFSPSNPDIVYAGGSAFYRSADGGATWERYVNSTGNWGPEGIRAGIPIDVVVDPENPTVVYVNNYGGGVFVSRDGARTWDASVSGYSGAEINDLSIPTDVRSKLYVIGRSGPYKSSDYGGSWTGIANGQADYAEWYGVAVKPGHHNEVLIVDEHDGVIFGSLDSGQNFYVLLKHPETDASDPNRRQGFKALVFAPSDPEIVYCGLARDRNNIIANPGTVGTVIYKSLDGGLTYQALGSIIDGRSVNQLAVAAKDPNLVLAAASDGLYKSTDGAVSWTLLPGSGNRNITAVALYPDQPNHIIAGEWYGGIWISQDGGATWTGPHNTGFNSANPTITALVIDPREKSTVFAGDLSSGVYRSLDNGLTWSPFPDYDMSGLSVRAVKDLALNDRVIYAATQGGGVFKYMRDGGTGYGPGLSGTLQLLLEEE